MAYEKQVGGRSATPVVWPQLAFPQLDATRDTLILFAHPHCPCSRASIEELNRILAIHRSSVAAHVLFLKPPGVSSSWTQSALRKSTESIPPIRVADDANGAIARAFGAETSGFVVVYSPEGRLLFSGGITQGRGHVGDNTSKNALLQRLERRQTAAVATPVFGCSLECRDVTSAANPLNNDAPLHSR